jgi:hypothetical protein
MIPLSFNISGEPALEHLNSTAALLEEAIRVRIDEQNAELQSVIVSEKLAGEILQRRTGNLADTVHVVPAQNDGSVITGYVEAGGSSAIYAQFQEYGTTRWYDIFPVNKQSLAFQIAGKLIFAKKVHHPPILERSFMRSTQTERQPEMTANLQAAVAEALRR